MTNEANGIMKVANNRTDNGIRKLQNCVNEKEFLHDAHTCPGLAPIVQYNMIPRT